MKRAEYSKAHFRGFLKVRSLELAKHVGCWALQTAWSEVSATFYELIPSLENL